MILEEDPQGARPEEMAHLDHRDRQDHQEEAEDHLAHQEVDQEEVQDRQEDQEMELEATTLPETTPETDQGFKEPGVKARSEITPMEILMEIRTITRAEAGINDPVPETRRCQLIRHRSSMERRATRPS